MAYINALNGLLACRCIRHKSELLPCKHFSWCKGDGHIHCNLHCQRQESHRCLQGLSTQE